MVGRTAPPGAAARGDAAGSPKIAWKASAAVAAALLAGCSTSDPDPVAPDIDAGEPPSHEEEMRALASDLGIEDPPEVAPRREISPSQSKDVHNDCMEESGWRVHPDGSITVPEDQEQSFRLASYICTARYPIAAEHLDPLTDDQWAVLYDHFQQQYIPCMEQEGFEVTPLPTRETFLADPTNAWQPVDDALERQIVERGMRGEYDHFDQVFQTCPRSPGDETLHGTSRGK